MPYTYPSPKQGQQQSTRPNPHPHYKPTLSHRSHTTQAVLPAPPITTPSSRYLTPIQEQRILSWRDNTTPSQPPSPASTHLKIKSAPASLSFSRTTPTGSSTYSRCPICADVSSCSCSSAQYAQVGITPPRKHKGYYKKSKNRTGSTLTSMTPITPATPCRPGTPAAAAAPSAARVVRQESRYSASSYAPDQGTLLTRPDPNGMPSPEQVQAYTLGAPPTAQWGPAPTIPLPEPKTAPAPELAAAPAPPPPPALPRIAGARDPIFQNYYRNMFPPAPGPFGIKPGLHPPQFFGMPAGRPMG